MGGLTPLEMGGGIKGIREKGKGKRVPLEMIFLLVKLLYG
jgi:hypothetical protein